MFKKIKISEKEEINSKKEHIEKKFPYTDLLSENSPKFYDDYSAEADILDSQIKKENVNNIAIVAQYGAGKSSVIYTYLEKYRKNKKCFINNNYIRISLATFNKNKYSESDIERSILQQLLYSKNKNILPNSNIKRTNTTSAPISGLKALVVSIFISASVLFGLEIGGAWLFRGKDITFILLGIAFFSLFIILKYLFHYGVLQKVKYKGIEADFSTENKDDTQNSQITNLINKFIDEVLYFFERTKINLVIFEDLDRLPTTEIFVKLRELNIIINNSDICEEKVTFLYAVKDEMIKTEEERAKFFDFILPVISIINPVTTEEMLRTKIKNLSLKNKKMEIHNNFIKGISRYISDMRILNNTFNDYIIMYNRIFEDNNANTDNMNNEKLFSICLYKNLFPYDYALLEKNKGAIPLLINLTEIRNHFVENINDNITSARKSKEELNEEKLHSFEELKAMFIGQVSTMPYGTSLNNALKDIKDITTFDGIDFNNIKHPIPRTVDNYRNFQYSLVNLQGKAEILTPSGEKYLDKENNINEKCNNGIEALNQKIAELERKKIDILSLKFSQIIKTYGMNGVDYCFQSDIKEKYKMEYFPIKNYEKNELNNVLEKYRNEHHHYFDEKQFDSQLQYLRFLIANDYIDEKYIEYTTNYKTKIISQEDNKFIMSVQRRQQDYEYIPNDIENVIKILNDEDFKYTSIFNKILISNMELIEIISKKENSKKYENYINLFKDTNTQQVFNSIRKYLESSDNNDCEKLLRYLIPIRPTLFFEIISEDSFAIEKINLLIINIIKYSNNYKAQDVNKKISLFISAYDDYLLLFQRVGDEKKIIQFIKEISPCFLKLSNIILNRNIQQYIIDNNHYAINLENLEVIYNINVNDNEIDFYKKNYGYIMSSDKKNVQEYIKNNKEKYVTKVILNEKITCLKETQDDIEDILLNDELDIAIRNEVIKKSNIKIDDIPRFNEKLYNILLKTKSIIPKWSTLFYVFEMIGADPIIDYLKHETEITGDFEIEEGAEDTPIKLINEILKKLSAIELKKLTEAIPTDFMLSELQADIINDDILSIFIEEGKISYQNNDFIIIYKKLNSLSTYIIQHNASIIENFDNFFNPIISLLIEDGIANHIILKIINCIKVGLKIKKLLIQKCEKIIEIYKNEKYYADFFIKNKIVIPSTILWQFTKPSLLSKNDKVIMLMQSIENINWINEYENLKKYVNTLVKETGAIINIDFIFEQTEQNEMLLKKLKEIGFLTYSKVKNKDEYLIKINPIKRPDNIV